MAVEEPDEEETQQCEWVIFAATQVEQEERCGGDALPGDRYCAAHAPWAED